MDPNLNEKEIIRENCISNYFCANIMACCTGETHTICLSDEGILYSFGRNKEGQLGQTEGKVSVPSQITKYYINNEVFTLPMINQISCGADFTICVDYEGFLYSFGENNRGLLGIGSTEKYFKYPQKIQDIPPVLSISCGVFHTLVITNDDNLWSFGNNEFGQLCLGNKENQVKPKQTQFSDIVKIAASYHSLFQNKKGEIYGCGETNAGQLCVNSSQPQTEVRRLEDHPSNIIQFCCGYYHSLFLDSQGNVFSIGFNHYGNLGIGNTIHQNKFCQIPNIPPIQSISCVGHSSYLIDIDGNLWSFGSMGAVNLGLVIRRIELFQPNIQKVIFLKLHQVVVEIIFFFRILKIKYLLVVRLGKANSELNALIQMYQCTKK